MCPLNELWEIIDQIVLHLLCLLPRLSCQSSRVHKQNNQNKAHCLSESNWNWTIVEYPSTGILLSTLIYPSYLTYEITFLTIGKICLVPHSLCIMPSRRAFFQNHLLESIRTPLKCQDLYFQIHWAFFFPFISWRYPAKTAGFCHSASVNMFIFIPNVRRVEI